MLFENRITGAALKGGLEIIGRIKAGRNPQTFAETQKIFNIKSQSENLTPKQIEMRNSGIDLKAELNEKLKLNEQIKTQPSAKNESRLIKQAIDNEPKIMSDLEGISHQSKGEMVG